MRGGEVATLTADDLEASWWKAPLRIKGTSYQILESHLWPLKKWSGEASVEGTVYTPTLNVGWCYEQKREEIAHMRLDSGYEGRMYRLRLHIGDITLDAATAYWVAGHTYESDDVVRHGTRYYRARKQHGAGESFFEDQAVWEEIELAGRPLPSYHEASFFKTARGRLAIEHALHVAQAYQRASWRSDEVTLEVPLMTALELSCDHDVSFVHPVTRKTHVGKVVRYRWKAADAGAFAEVTLGVSDRRTIPTFELGDLQEDSGPLGLVTPHRWGARELVRSIRVENDAPFQQRALSGAVDRQEARDRLREMVTSIEIELQDIATTDVLRHQVECGLRRIS